ncbi:MULTISPECIES: hypothetical protein, partial [unclassified Raoultella]|uniref:hypothetical protein n=1 Tax=unclassified Raoultella TaxID=2627600 RepID=UPI001D12D9FF
TRHTSSCMCVGYVRSPESLTGVSSSGFTPLPPSCNLNYLEYIGEMITAYHFRRDKLERELKAYF